MKQNKGREKPSQHKAIMGLLSRHKKRGWMGHAVAIILGSCKHAWALQGRIGCEGS